ncbi:proton channel OTOP3-like [Lampris incognitus]|uniref:proton channel OTOP3-like n=1 Tax=Lampris incognitus TaxID=2546036 RepID=UPI0024B4DC3F|nr:proton channel OTOP3-like [Lampris incognitus]
MNSDPSETATSMVSDIDGSPGVLESSSNVEPRKWENFEHQIQDPELDPLFTWDPSGRRLLSGLLGLNVVLLGSALVASQAFNPMGLKHQEPQVFLLLLMVCSMVWMLWYLLWTRRQPGVSPHKDHHAGGVTVTVVLMLFATFSLLLHVFRIGYSITMRECKPAAQVLTPFIEAPFLGLQTYLLWAHSKDCVHRHKIITRSGLIVTLCADLLLWLNAVTEDSIHQEIELEKEARINFGNTNFSESAESSSAEGMSNTTVCQCTANAVCLIFRRGYEILYPFNIEYYLMAGCMLYVMWKNVGRRASPGPHEHVTQKLTLRIVYRGGIFVGPLLGFLVLIIGVTIFILYQVWVSQRQHRFIAFLMFYGYHLAVMPVMSLCSLAGMLIHKLERRAEVGGHNPTRSLDVILLVGAALGQLALSYFSLVAAFALGASGPLGSLDLSYSLLSLLELMLQNIFIIEGLHRHPSLSQAKKRARQRSIIFKPKRKVNAVVKEVKTDASFLEGNVTSTAPPADQGGNGKQSWTKRATQEICAFLILSNVMLWIIPAFGANPQFENGLGKEFFGFTAWFVLVNLGQPLGVFYRMHSVGALMELLISA